MAPLMHRLVYTPEAIVPPPSFPPPHPPILAPSTSLRAGFPHRREGMRRQAGRGERCKALALTGERHPMPPAGEDVNVQSAKLPKADDSSRSN